MREPRASGQRGSVLALMPAAALVFMMLGSVAVDSALAYLGEREASNLAAAVANDAATKGIDIARFYASGELALDPARVQAVADQAVRTNDGGHLEDLTIETEVVGSDRIVVRVRARVRSLFARALPEGFEERDVGASAEATAERG